MDDNVGPKNNTIKQIFDTMGYGDDMEDVTEAIEWLKTKNNRLFAYIDKSDETPNGEVSSLKNVNNDDVICDIYTPEAATIEKILKKQAEAKNAWIDVPPIKRTELIKKLGDQIQQDQDLFVQLEVIARGILSQDTKRKALTLLTDYLSYYASFCIKYNADNPSWKPEGVAVGIISDSHSLSTFGCFLGPCLAAGYHVALQTGPQLSILAAFLIDLATEVGIPEGTIRLIPGAVEPNTLFMHPNVSVISIFDDLHREKYFIGNHLGKKFLNFYSSGIPMLVFDNCDLDSACFSVVDATWGYKGMVPWSLKNIFIQESVFQSFVQKAKHRIDRVLVGNSNKKNVDLSMLDHNTSVKLNEIIQKAKNEGVEVYPPQASNSIPALFIGGNIFNNNVIKEDYIDVPIVTLTAFRTIEEAVALANNTRQGLAASIWTESTSLSNEIIRTLKVGNIWLNSHGLFSADIATSPYKTSGNGYFGGREGFYEYVQLKNLTSETTSQVQNGEAMERAITEAKKAQESWYKMTRFERAKTLQNIDASKTTWDLPEKWLNDWIVLIHDYSLNHQRDSFMMKKGFNVMSLREPCGVVAAETLEDVETHNKRLIIASLIEGNAVIILNDSKVATAFYSCISKLLPKGVFVVVPYAQDAVKVAALHKELNVYFGEKGNTVFWSLPLKSSSKFKVAKSDNWNEVQGKITLAKNVWCNVGQSFT